MELNTSNHTPIISPVPVTDLLPPNPPQASSSPRLRRSKRIAQQRQKNEFQDVGCNGLVGDYDCASTRMGLFQAGWCSPLTIISGEGPILSLMTPIMNISQLTTHRQKLFFPRCLVFH